MTHLFVFVMITCCASFVRDNVPVCGVLAPPVITPGYSVVAVHDVHDVALEILRRSLVD